MVCRPVVILELYHRVRHGTSARSSLDRAQKVCLFMCVCVCVFALYINVILFSLWTALDLLSLFLKFCPENRITIDEALAHPFLADVRDIEVEVRIIFRFTLCVMLISSNVVYLLFFHLTEIGRTASFIL